MYNRITLLCKILQKVAIFSHIFSLNIDTGNDKNNLKYSINLIDNT